MIRVLAVLLVSTFCSFAFAQNIRYRGRTYVVGRDAPICSNPNCRMCQRLRAGLQTSQPVYSQPVRSTPQPVYSQPVYSQPVVISSRVVRSDPPPPKKASPPAKPVITPQKLKEVEQAFDPTPFDAIEKMLDLANLQPGDVVVDPGCGDARLLIEAAKREAVLCLGYEINPQTAAKAQANITSRGFQARVHVKCEDATERDWIQADVILAYMFDRVMRKIMFKLEPGTRIVSFMHPIPDAEGQERHESGDFVFFTWTVPAVDLERWDVLKSGVQ